MVMVSNQTPSVESSEERSEETPATASSETVSFDSYQKLLNQRKADQAKAKELADRLAALESEKSQNEERRLKEANEWKIVAERKETELKKIQDNWKADQAKFKEYHQLNSFLAEVGGLKRPEYSSFVDYSKIQICEDGSIDPDSVKEYANQFRQTYPDLIKSSQPASLPTNAPANAKNNNQKSLSEMSEEELKQAWKSMRS